jgi:mRNA-degrading endonuclease RelE of RelBE toxin-antitoxin system
MWRIEYYAEPSGRQPVAEWLDSLSKKTRNFIQDKIDSLQKHGTILLNTNMMRRLKGYGGDFYEIKYSKYRITLYHEPVNNTFILLHGFKKERKRESKEIEKAYSRLRNYQSRG